MKAVRINKFLNGVQYRFDSTISEHASLQVRNEAVNLIWSAVDNLIWAEIKIKTKQSLKHELRKNYHN